MGLSAKDSRIYYVAIDCPVLLDGTSPSDPTGLTFSEQVVRIEITPSVYQRKYGHDKSFGANDVCSGIKSWDGNITTKVADSITPFSFTAGDVVWLRIWPLGRQCGGPIQGYASIDSDPVVCNLENGEPVEHNYRYSSKGLWKGILGRGTTGRYECECSSGAAGSIFEGAAVGSAAVPEVIPAGLPAHTPITAYQWNGAAWLPAYDECHNGFAPGPALDPVSQPGKFVGELAFVECVAQ